MYNNCIRIMTCSPIKFSSKPIKHQFWKCILLDIDKFNYLIRFLPSTYDITQSNFFFFEQMTIHYYNLIMKNEYFKYLLNALKLIAHAHSKENYPIDTNIHYKIIGKTGQYARCWIWIILFHNTQLYRERHYWLRKVGARVQFCSYQPNVKSLLVWRRF